MRSMARQPDTRMAASWRWPGRTGEVLEGRDAVYRSLEEEQAVLARTPTRGEAESILSLAEHAYGDLSAAELERPSAWAEFEFDVRFRLHRFTRHLIEHTIQCEKVLAALGHQPGDAAHIIRRVCAMRGAHAARSSRQTLAELDVVHLERARGL